MSIIVELEQRIYELYLVLGSTFDSRERQELLTEIADIQALLRQARKQHDRQD